ncbi:hypothetical protein ACX0G9_26550 [Flavitalea flava]
MNSTLSIAVFIVLVVLLFIVLLIVISRREQNKTRKKMDRLLTDLIDRNNLTIDSKEEFRKRIIAVDRVNEQLLFIDLNGEEERSFLVNLPEVVLCRLIKNERPDKGHINKIFLECTMKGKKETLIQLPFYDEMTDSLQNLPYLSKNADYWKQKINIYANFSNKVTSLSI